MARELLESKLHCNRPAQLVSHRVVAHHAPDVVRHQVLQHRHKCIVICSLVQLAREDLMKLQQMISNRIIRHAFDMLQQLVLQSDTAYQHAHHSLDHL